MDRARTSPELPFHVGEILVPKITQRYLHSALAFCIGCIYCAEDCTTPCLCVLDCQEI